MPPELQNLMQQAQQAQDHAMFQAKLVGYSSYAALIICAIFSILIFRKLCQIHELLKANSYQQQPSERINPFTNLESHAPISSSPVSSAQPEADDDRYKPKE